MKVVKNFDEVKELIKSYNTPEQIESRKKDLELVRFTYDQSREDVYRANERICPEEVCYKGFDEDKPCYIEFLYLDGRSEKVYGDYDGLHDKGSLFKNHFDASFAMADYCEEWTSEHFDPCKDTKFEDIPCIAIFHN